MMTGYSMNKECSKSTAENRKIKKCHIIIVYLRKISKSILNFIKNFSYKKLVEISFGTSFEQGCKSQV